MAQAARTKTTTAAVRRLNFRIRENRMGYAPVRFSQALIIVRTLIVESSLQASTIRA